MFDQFVRTSFSLTHFQTSRKFASRSNVPCHCARIAGSSCASRARNSASVMSRFQRNHGRSSDTMSPAYPQRLAVGDTCSERAWYNRTLHRSRGDDNGMGSAR